MCFEDNVHLPDVMEKASVTQSMFLAWFEANKKYPVARHLTYVEFHTFSVYKAKDCQWYPR